MANDAELLSKALFINIRKIIELRFVVEFFVASLPDNDNQHFVIMIRALQIEQRRGRRR